MSISPKNSLDHLIEKGSEQANRVVIDIVGTTSTNYIKTIIEKGFERYSVLQELFLLKGSRLIRINRQMSQTKTFMESFKKVWNKNK
jgi:hypothetical protein